MAILAKAINRFNRISIKISIQILKEQFQYCMRTLKNPQESKKNNSDNRIIVGSIIIPEFKLYYRAIVSKCHVTDTKTDVLIDRIKA